MTRVLLCAAAACSPTFTFTLTLLASVVIDATKLLTLRRETSITIFHDCEGGVTYEFKHLCSLRARSVEVSIHDMLFKDVVETNRSRITYHSSTKKHDSFQSLDKFNHRHPFKRYKMTLQSTRKSTLIKLRMTWFDDHRDQSF